MIGRTLTHYRILEKIGEGGMGIVYRAHDERLDRDVALKVLPAGALAEEAVRKRFRKEALALSLLNHPNISTVHDFDSDGGVDFLVMELIPGVTLTERIAAGPLPEKEIEELGSQLAQGLAAAHDQGVLHRDMKPGNLRITPDGRLKILDFGLAKVIGPVSDSALTETFQDSPVLAGTIPYMAPEQLRGEPFDPRSDIYGAGVVLYEMTAGRRPFLQSSMPPLIDAILHLEPEPPGKIRPGVTAGLEALILKAMDKDAARRHQSAAELRSELERFRALPPVREPSRRAARLGWKLALTAIFVLLLAAAGYLLRERIRPSKEPAAERITLAVLPLHTLSVPQEIRFLGVGIADSIITRLANVRQMLPRPTSAILRYENQNVDPQEVGRNLSSQYVLTGMVQQAGERLRVSVQLVRGKDGAPIWGNHYDVGRADLLNLQDSIAEQIAKALQIQMSASERARFYRRYTNNQEAYQLYLQGRSHLARSTREATVLAAVEAFEGALRLDPEFPLARAGVAQASAVMRLRFAPESEVKGWAQRAEREARRAVDADPHLGEAHEALAAVYRATEFDWERAIEESRRALDLNPSLIEPHYYRAAAFYHLGLMDLVEGEVRAALEIDPNGVDAPRTRGITALWSGRFEEAEPQLEEARRLMKNSTFDWVLAQAYYYHGKHARAEELLVGIQGQAVSDRRAQAVLSSFLAARVEKAPAETLLRNVVSGYMDHHVAYSVGATHAQLGNPSEARRWLAQAFETGLACYPWYQRDPLLEPLRRDPEFQRFLEGFRKSWESAKIRFERENH
jgi:TolB-like protein